MLARGHYSGGKGPMATICLGGMRREMPYTTSEEPERLRYQFGDPPPSGLSADRPGMELLVTMFGPWDPFLAELLRPDR